MVRRRGVIVVSSPTVREGHEPPLRSGFVTSLLRITNDLSAIQEQIGNARFQNALARRPQPTPPIWLMRQAGRYHKHYQALRARHSFMELCKQPELAARSCAGASARFWTSTRRFFSAICCFRSRLSAMGLEYTDQGPQLIRKSMSRTFRECARLD